MQLVITVRDGATTSEMSAALRFQANLFDGIEPKAAASKELTGAPAVGKTTTAATTKAKPKAPPVEDADDDFAQAEEEDSGVDFDAEESSEEEDDFAAPPEKKAAAKKAAAPKPPKLTIDDVNDACKKKAASIGGKPGREKVLAALKKHFKTSSVSELKPEQYAACIKLMEVK